EVHAAGDAVRDRALDLRARILKPVVEGADVVELLHLERDLLDVLRLLPGLPSPHERQLVVLGVGLRAQEADAALEILVGDGEAQHAGIEVAHLPEIVAVEPDVAQSGDPWHGPILTRGDRTAPHCPTGASASSRA